MHVHYLYEFSICIQSYLYHVYMYIMCPLMVRVNDFGSKPAIFFLSILEAMALTSYIAS